MIERRGFPPLRATATLAERSTRAREAAVVARAVTLDLRHAECACGAMVDAAATVPQVVLALLAEGSRIDPAFARLLRVPCPSCQAPVRFGRHSRRPRRRPSPEV